MIDKETMKRLRLAIAALLLLSLAPSCRGKENAKPEDPTPAAPFPGKPTAALIQRPDRRLLDRAEQRKELLTGGPSEAPSTADVAARAVNMLEELGPTFVKFGQILSTRPDLIPIEYVERLQVLQDHVTAVSLEDVRRQIQSALGAAPETLFAKFDTSPIASAALIKSPNDEYGIRRSS